MMFFFCLTGNSFQNSGNISQEKCREIWSACRFWLSDAEPLCCSHSCDELLKPARRGGMPSGCHGDGERLSLRSLYPSSVTLSPLRSPGLCWKEQPCCCNLLMRRSQAVCATGTEKSCEKRRGQQGHPHRHCFLISTQQRFTADTVCCLIDSSWAWLPALTTHFLSVSVQIASLL